MNKKEKYKSIYHKMIGIYIIINLFLILGMQQIECYAKEQLKAQYTQSILASCKLQIKGLESNLLYAKCIQDIIINDHRVKWLIHQAPIESLYNIYSKKQEVQELLAVFELTNPVIEDIGVYIKHSNEIISSKKGWIKELDPIDIHQIEQKIFIVPYLHKFYLMNVPLAVNGEYHSFAYITINDKWIQTVIQDIQNMLQGIEVGIIQGDQVLYQTEDFERHIVEQGNDIGEGGNQVIKLSGREYLLLQTELVSGDIKVSMYFDTDEIFAPIRRLNELFNICLLISVGAGCLFMVYTHQLINKPLKKLMDSMKQIKENNWEVDITYSSNDQFQYIFEGLKCMIDELKLYMERIYKQEIEINKSELKQLQSQINPHFLYNCFFNISKMCKIEDSEGAMVLSQKLAKYYMYITRNGSDTVCLEEEYAHTKIYLDIQKIRFGDRVTIKVDEISKGFTRIEVPRIILQPIVENCYKYVFEKIGEKGELHIQIQELTKNIILVEVQDNGSLITDEELAELDRQLLSDEKRKETTGLFNVNRRLKLKLGYSSGIRIKRGELGGMSVQVIIAKEE